MYVSTSTCSPLNAMTLIIIAEMAPRTSIFANRVSLHCSSITSTLLGSKMLQGVHFVEKIVITSVLKQPVKKAV